MCATSNTLRTLFAHKAEILADGKIVNLSHVFRLAAHT